MKRLFSGIRAPAKIVIQLDKSPSLPDSNNTITVAEGGGGGGGGGGASPPGQTQTQASAADHFITQTQTQTNKSAAQTQTQTHPNPNKHQHYFFVGDDVAAALAAQTSNSSNSKNSTGAAAHTHVYPLYLQDDPISGRIHIQPDKAFEHQGIKIELIGEIVTYHMDSKQTSHFTQLSKELSGPGTLSQATTLDFQFKNVEKEFESYRGMNADLRYYVRVSISRSMFSMSREQEFWVQCVQAGGTPRDALPENDPGISMEVGLTGNVPIVLLSIKYDRVYYELGSGVIEGRLRFYVVNVKIDRAEVSIIKKETTGQGENAVTEQETLKKFEIIDGTPAKDEVVPVRLYLSGLDAWRVTPTVTNVNNKYSVKYFLHLALLDSKGRRFFKQREIIFWRGPTAATQL